jgi:hypothetical protein
MFAREGALIGNRSGATVTCLRSVLMKPEHEQWVDEIWLRLNQASSGY